MATRHLNEVIDTLRRTALLHEGAALTDGQLLECYVSRREDAALAALVRRHGPMVWGVCRRILRKHQDAEDAFQATFLVLVRKAAAIVPRQKVANWLYGVARQTALNARATSAKREKREKQVPAMPEPAAEPQGHWEELRVQLDQELGRLPEKYREAIVLCDLEGKTRKEVARQLGLPEGTVATRVATARTMLARRLARSGLAVSGGALATVLSKQVASAGVPHAVVSNTIKAASLYAAGKAAATGALSVKAVALADGVLKTMLLTKLKIATAGLLAIAVFATGAAAFMQPELVKNPAHRAVDEKKEPADQLAREKQDAENNMTVVNGTVKAVDTVKNALTVTEKAGEHTYTVAKDAEIFIDGKPGRLAGLPPGPHTYVTLTVDHKTAQKINATGRHFPSVVVEAVDAGKNTITFAGNKQPPEIAGKTFTLATDAGIMIDGVSGKLAEVPAGALVSLYLCVDQKTVHGFHAEGPRFQGVVVKAVDAERKTITLDRDKAPPELAGRTLPLAKNAYVEIERKEAKLAGISSGAVVNLTLSVDCRAVRVIQTERP